MRIFRLNAFRGKLLRQLSRIEHPALPNARKKLALSTSDESTGLRHLTAREYETVGLLALGYDYRAIAFVTRTTYSAVRNLFRRIHEKTGPADKLELAVMFAREVFMGYDNGGAVSASFPKRFTVDGSGGFESRRLLVTPVIFPEHSPAASLSAEDL